MNQPVSILILIIQKSWCRQKGHFQAFSLFLEMAVFLILIIN